MYGQSAPSQVKKDPRPLSDKGRTERCSAMALVCRRTNLPLLSILCFTAYQSASIKKLISVSSNTLASFFKIVLLLNIPFWAVFVGTELSEDA